MMVRKLIRLATRESPLAVAQAKIIKAELEQRHLHVDVVICPMSTKGDRMIDVPLAAVGGKGLFTKELELALRGYEVDVAVHSMKDMPVQLPKGLCIPVISKREDPRDVFISLKYEHISLMPKGARIGTCSLRRQCQILAKYPHLVMQDIRGNIQTRLEKLNSGAVDAIILAAAGMKRMGLEDGITHYFEPEELLPAVGQGAIALECRLEDKDTQHLLQGINCETSHACVMAERAVNAALDGGCQVPLAMHAVRYGPTISLHALVGEPDGSVILRSALSGHMTDPHSLGRMVADELIAQGAKIILEKVYAANEQNPTSPNANV